MRELAQSCHRGDSFQIRGGGSARAVRYAAQRSTRPTPDKSAVPLGADQDEVVKTVCRLIGDLPYGIAGTYR